MYRDMVDLALQCIDAGTSGFRTREDTQPQFWNKNVPPMEVPTYHLYLYFLAPAIINAERLRRKP